MRSSWKLLNAVDDPYLVHVEQNTSNSDILSQISLWQSSHWRFIRYYRSSNSNHCSSNWGFEFEHFFEIIPILVISKKYIWCRCRDNLNQLRSNWKSLYGIYDTYSLRIVQIHFKFEHFFEIIPVLLISKKSVQYHCRWNLNQLRSSWKLLNAIDDRY